MELKKRQIDWMDLFDGWIALVEDDQDVDALASAYNASRAFTEPYSSLYASMAFGVALRSGLRCPFGVAGTHHVWCRCYGRAACPKMGYVPYHPICLRKGE